jgi:predicted TIM-barrel fold metal-dependent hydrolase
MGNKTDLDLPPRSPIHFGAASNGEFPPQDPPPEMLEAERRLQELAAAQSRHLGMSRRSFLSGPCGTAAALFVLNGVSGCHTYQVKKEMLSDEHAARELLRGDEIIVDMQTHHVDAREDAEWVRNNPEYHAIFEQVAQSKSCGQRKEKLACIARDTYIHEVFVASETRVAVLSGVPSRRSKSPLSNDEIRATRDIVNHMASSQRLLAQAVVHPHEGSAALEDMHSLAEEMNVVGWKVYTPFGKNGVGWWLDDPATGLAFLEQVRKSGRKVVFCHKGLPWPVWNREYTSPRDIGPAARLFPDIQIVCYHSGYDQDTVEGPYSAEHDRGIDQLIKSCADHGIGANRNVWAEIGGTWFVLMRKPLEAAHALGKLLKHFGEDRILWGTDAVFLGSPQSQLEAFRALQIPEELQEKHGYPALTPRIKAKILGQNAAQLLGIDLHQPRYRLQDRDLEELRSERDRRPAVYGPITRREYLRLWASHRWGR